MVRSHTGPPKIPIVLEAADDVGVEVAPVGAVRNSFRVGDRFWHARRRSR